MHDAIDKYLKYIEFEKKYSPHTLREYSNDLGLLYAFLQKENRNSTIDPFMVTPSDLREWVLSLLDKGESRATVHRRVSSVKAFYRYHNKIGATDNNPARLVLLPKIGRRLPLYLDEENAAALLPSPNVTPDDFPTLRDNTLLTLLYLTGIRQSEAIGLNISDVDTRSCTITVLGKRNKQRNIPFPRWFAQQLEYYLQKRSQTFPDAGPKLLLSNKGNHLYPKFVYQVTSKAISQVSTLQRKGPHTLRHTFATHLLNAGAELNSIKELLGHSSLAATQVYTHNNFEKLKATHKQAHPRN